MPLDSEKKRLEARLLHLLSQALQTRNRDDIVGTSLELGALYLSGDLYDKAEECFRRVLDDPLAGLAVADEKARAEASLAQVALRRGHLTLAGEALRRADKLASSRDSVWFEIRRLTCVRDLQRGRYEDVLATIQAAMARESPAKLGDLRVEFMVLEARARRLLGLHHQAGRLLHSALEIAEQSGFEAGTSVAKSELGALHTTLGAFKDAQTQLQQALESHRARGSQFRLDIDRRRVAALNIRMGRWQDAEAELQQVHESSRALRTLENRLASQLVRAELRQLQGRQAEARQDALDALDVARAAGYVRYHVQGLVTLAAVELEGDGARAALEGLGEAEALYEQVAPQSPLMIRVHVLFGRALVRQGQMNAAFERLMRAHNLARDTAVSYERFRIDSDLAAYSRHQGDLKKAAVQWERVASDLGSLGAKYEVALARLRYAQVLNQLRVEQTGSQRDRSTKLARSNLFEARRLLESLGAERDLAECAVLEAELPPAGRS